MAARSRLVDLWRRGQRGWPASFPIAQLPNPPLIVAFAGLGAGAVAPGPVRPYARAAFYGGLSVWAWEELTSGANWLRRSLGAAGLAYVVVAAGGAPDRGGMARAG